ncbi:zinc ribbon domain-containing protein [Lacihabitans soyangensis]|uniref:DUF3667 domain-containing protein n=1 Tax=Lacihabitans soyangensis TaxID=869394 RepID=A0AAE3KTU8_9BACT|nr:zinc ribbon domain-containing protein [Lacihabitans soyangensis]MCP9764139.1 DUF3667 domain-containing protein [Lacihabitans soyangensis]
MTCHNCEAPFDTKFCPNCGNPAILKRIDKHYLQHEFLHLFHVEKGFLYTVKMLLSKPGESIQGFLKTNRNKLMKPVPFLIFASLIYTIIGGFFGTADETHNLVKIDKKSTELAYLPTILNWVQTHHGYANMTVSVFIAMLLKLFFKKHKYNYFEILTMMCFVLGINMLAMTLIAPFYSLPYPIIYRILFLVFVFGYTVWAIGRFFDKTKVLGYLKGAFAFIMGYIIYYAIILGIGLGLDMISKSINH